MYCIRSVYGVIKAIECDPELEGYDEYPYAELIEAAEANIDFYLNTIESTQDLVRYQVLEEGVSKEDLVAHLRSKIDIWNKLYSNFLEKRTELKKKELEG